MNIQRVCVFSGSRPGKRPSYRAAAEDLGRAIARRGWSLVYGGASVGLMGAVADATLAAGGKAIGVIPQGLVEKEIAHDNLPELIVVGTMHERKAKMVELSDAFIALPGGFGTFDELFEVVTWAQLGLHQKPIGLLDVEGYWQPTVALVETAVREGFVPEDQRGLLLVEKDPEALFEAMLAFEFPKLGRKWVDARDV